MATIPKTSATTGNDRSVVYQWVALQNGDDGEVMPFSQYADKSVQVTGTFGGGTVRFEGSNDGGLNWAPLTDVQGNPLDFTSAKIKQVTEATALARPRVTAGDGTTALTISLFMRQT